MPDQEYACSPSLFSLSLGFLRNHPQLHAIAEAFIKWGQYDLLHSLIVRVTLVNVSKGTQRSIHIIGVN